MLEQSQNEMELCLCGVCARAFYNIPSYKIVRKDPYQQVKELCTYCGYRFGFDYLISHKSNV